MNCVGIDPGSAIGKGTLVCVLDHDGQATFHKCASKEKKLVYRFRVILAGLRDALRGTAPATCIERPTGLQGNAQQLHGLYWLIVNEFYCDILPTWSVAPMTLKKFVAGTGKADKAQVATAITRQWACCLPEGRDLDMDEADSFGMAMVARCRAGLPNPNGKPWTVTQLECAAKAEEL